MMTKLILGVLVVAAVSTASDYTWYEIGVGHRMVTGIITGIVMLMAVGGALGWVAGRLVNGLWLGVIAGLIGALAYYALQPVIGRNAMIAAWASLWIILAIGEGRLAAADRDGRGATCSCGGGDRGRVERLSLSTSSADDSVGPRAGRADGTTLLQFGRWLDAVGARDHRDRAGRTSVAAAREPLGAAPARIPPRFRRRR